MNADHALLRVDRLNVWFKRPQGALHAVRELSFHVDRAETLALVGESGCGKSTTALAILRLLAPSASLDGHVWFSGTDLLDLPVRAMRALRGSRIAMIFQEPMTSLNPVYSIGHQIVETLRRHEALSARAARQRAIELLDLVRIAEPQRRIDDYPHQLSGGQRQRVMIAMAVSCRPALLIADEPTTALDVTIQAQVLELLAQLRRELAMGVLLITHDLGVVAQWADRVAVMFGGSQVEYGSTQTLFTRPAHPYTQGLLGASLHSGTIVHHRRTLLPEIRVAHDAGAQRFTLHTPPLPPQTVSRADISLLSVRHLSTTYATPQGQVHAVNDVSFDIRAGQSLGLVGESGSGKSTLCKTLMRLIPANAGSIVFDGVDVTALSERRLKPWRKRVQMVFQDPYASLNPRRTVFDMLDTVLRVHGVVDAAQRRQRIAAMLDCVGLPRNAAQRYPNEFSGGQRQRIGIARALILQPALLILDEPVSALDVSVQAQILNLLVELKAALHLAYFFISHDLAVVRYIADDVLVMHRGRIVESGSHAQIWHTPQHAYTQSLLASMPGRTSSPSSINPPHLRPVPTSPALVHTSG